MQKKGTLQALTECAVMLALSTVLSLVSVFRMPYGGSVTPCSMVPLLYIAFRWPLKWSLATALGHGLLQMILEFSTPPTAGLLSYAAVVALDYLAAFGALGLAGVLSGGKRDLPHVLLGAGLALAGRFACHFLSGIIIWGVYAPEGQSVAVYSLLYNGSYMLAELALSLAALTALVRSLPRKLLWEA